MKTKTVLFMSNNYFGNLFSFTFTLLNYLTHFYYINYIYNNQFYFQVVRTVKLNITFFQFEFMFFLKPIEEKK
jgi:hypothetical protein